MNEDEYKYLDYRAFNLNIKDINDIECTNKINSIDELKKIITENTSADVYYIINHKTNNAILFTSLNIYLIDPAIIEEMKKLKNIYYINTDDIWNNQQIFKDHKLDVFDYKLHSIKGWTYYDSHNWYKNKNMNYQLSKFKFDLSAKNFAEYIILNRIRWMFEALFITLGANEIINNIYFIDKDNTKKLLYKEFFLNKDYTEEIDAEAVSITETYLSNDINDYKDKEYGVIIDLDKISFIRNKWNIDVSDLSEYKWNRERKEIIKNSINAAFCFFPKLDGEQIRPRLENLLKQNYKKVYTRIQKGLAQLTNNYANPQILTFRIIPKNSFNFTISNIKFADLSRVELLDGNKNIIPKIFKLIYDNNGDWVYFKDKSVEKKDTLNYINIKLLKENKYNIKVDTIKNYHGETTALLTLSKGSHHMTFKDPEDACLDILCNAGLFDEETKNLLKCELILKNM